MKAAPGKKEYAMLSESSCNNSHHEYMCIRTFEVFWLVPISDMKADYPLPHDPLTSFGLSLTWVAPSWHGWVFLCFINWDISLKAPPIVRLGLLLRSMIWSNGGKNARNIRILWTTFEKEGSLKVTLWLSSWNCLLSCFICPSDISNHINTLGQHHFVISCDAVVLIGKQYKPRKEVTEKDLSWYNEPVFCGGSKPRSLKRTCVMEKKTQRPQILRKPHEFRM